MLLADTSNQRSFDCTRVASFLHSNASMFDLFDRILAEPPYSAAIICSSTASVELKSQWCAGFYAKNYDCLSHLCKQWRTTYPTPTAFLTTAVSSVDLSWQMHLSPWMMLSGATH